jgi:hypothetical protein
VRGTPGAPGWDGIWDGEPIRTPTGGVWFFFGLVVDLPF